MYSSKTNLDSFSTVFNQALTSLTLLQLSTTFNQLYDSAWFPNVSLWNNSVKDFFFFHFKPTETEVP